MNRAGCGSQTRGPDRASVRRSGSWSQCVRKSERRLPINPKEGRVSPSAPPPALYRLPKVISEMVRQTYRFAATTRRSSPTISEISFGNHSSPAGARIHKVESLSFWTEI